MYEPNRERLSTNHGASANLARHPITMFAVIIILFGNLKNIIIYNQGDKQEENDLTDICAWFKRLLCCWYYNVL